MKVDEIKCDWLTRLARIRKKQEDEDFFDDGGYLIGMFLWNNTPEGFDFWHAVHRGLIKDKYQAIVYLIMIDVVKKGSNGIEFINGKETHPIYKEKGLLIGQ